MIQNTVIQFICFLLLFSSTWAEGPISKCEGLEGKFKAYRSLTPSELDEYCKEDCTFLRRMNCAYHVQTSEPMFDSSIIFDWFERLLNDTTPDSAGISHGLRVDINASTYGMIFKQLIPYLAVFIPIILQWVIIGSKAGNEFGNRAWLIAFNIVGAIGFVAFYGFKTVITVNYLGYAYMSAFSVVGHKAFQDIITMYGALFVLIAVSLSTDDLIVLGVSGLCIGVGFIGQIYIIVGRRSYSDRASLITTLCNLAVAGDLLQRVLYTFAIDNFSVAIVQLAIRAVMPVGETESLWDNSVIEASFVAGHISFGSNRVRLGVFVIALFGYLGLFLVTRAAIGVMVLSSLKFDWSINCLSTGIYAYAIDFTHPVMMVFEHCLSSKENSVRRVMYGMLMISLTVCEFFYARDWLLVRLMLFILDVQIFHSGLANASRFLESPIDLHGIAFPKPGSFPFSSLDALVKIRSACKRLTMRVNAEVPMEYSGVGMLWHGRDGPRLVTVQHVLNDKQSILFKAGDINVHEEVKSVDVVGDSVDPAVSMRLLVQHDDSTDIRFLSTTEVKLVSHLFIITPDGNVAPIVGAHFDSKGDIHANVNLMKGDSGTPIIAVLKDGTCRFAGTVSRGDSRSGHSNLISCVAISKSFRGSPGIENPYLEISNIRTQSDLDIISVIKDTLRKNRAEFLDEFYPDEERDRDDYDFRDVRGNNNKRVKNWKKDARARKFGFQAIVQASILTPEQQREMLQAFDDCRVIEFNAQRARRGYAHGIGFVPRDNG